MIRFDAQLLVAVAFKRVDSELRADGSRDAGVIVDAGESPNASNDDALADLDVGQAELLAVQHHVPEAAFVAQVARLEALAERLGAFVQLGAADVERVREVEVPIPAGGQTDCFFLSIDGDPDSARVEVNEHPMPFAVGHRRAVYQLRRPVPFVHQKPNFTLEQLDPEVIGVGRLTGVVEQQPALRARLQLELPSANRTSDGKLEGSRTQTRPNLLRRIDKRVERRDFSHPVLECDVKTAVTTSPGGYS